MRKRLTKILFYYSAVASIFIAISTAYSSKTLGSVIFTLLFLPVCAYFIIEFFNQKRD